MHIQQQTILRRVLVDIPRRNHPAFDRLDPTLQCEVVGRVRVLANGCHGLGLPDRLALGAYRGLGAGLDGGAVL